MSVFIDGILLKNYRGIGERIQKIAKFERCNFFIGTNNSGKSCVLNFLSSHLRNASQLGLARLELGPLELHLGAHSSQLAYGFATQASSIEEVLKDAIVKNNVNISASVFTCLKNILNKFSENDLIWNEIDESLHQTAKLVNFSSSEIVRPLLADNEWQSLWHALTRQTGGNVQSHWVPEVLQIVINSTRRVFPNAVIIPAIRQIGAKGNSFSDLSGKGLIDRLAELQNPGPTQRHLSTKFSAINKFLQEVTGDEAARIEIPHDREEVLVEMNRRVLPLSSLGTGIQEVVMIAAFCTLTEESIVCIEEPEIHLHPILQKKLIRYINSKTTNQYFIATHSASIIDFPGTAVFHVFQSNNETQIELAALPSQKFNACRDLGYRASDILQANSIIWVEGPSDRIYLKNWIQSMDPGLQEGIHFSVMFYGGRLLSHLSSSDEDVSEFINLRFLNRNMAIIIDSDKKNRSSSINETKKRVVQEFKDNSEISWVTAGREIENYLNPDVLEASLQKIYPSYESRVSIGQYEHALHFKKSGKGDVFKDVDKVKVAREMCKTPLDLNILDLKKNVAEIVHMIKSANDLH